MSKKIAVIPGDGIGQEITTAAVELLREVSKKYNCPLQFEEYPAGGTAYDLSGEPLPESTLKGAKDSDAVLFGAVGGPQWDDVAAELRPEKAVLGLRKGLELYANLRPIKVMDALVDNSPLKNEIIKATDILIVRELTGGIYFGERCESEIFNGVERAWDLENYTVPEVQRIADFAFKAAQGRRSKVTSVDKANVLSTSRLWHRTVEKVAEKYPEVKLNHLYVDNCAMQLALNPRQFDVIVTGNLFGDILSDEAAVLTGSIGMLPSASIGVSTSLYEPIHGSAPDIAGLDKANPLATMLSAAMLCRYSLAREDMASAIETAIGTTIAQGYRTSDIAGPGDDIVGTKKITELIINNLK